MISQVSVFALIEKNNRYLLIREAGNQWHGSWFLAGGKVKKGEDPLLALHRETEEEIGASIEIHGIFYFRYYRKLFSSNLQIFYRAHLTDKVIKKSSDTEIRESDWFTFDELKKLPLRQDARSIVAAYRELLCVLPPWHFKC